MNVGLNGNGVIGRNDIELINQSFGREHFRRMILKTFDDYYPQDFNRSTFKIDEYMNLVGREQLEIKYGVHLDVSERNMVDIRNMPWFDMGDLPISYNINTSEASQVYYIP